MIEGGGGVIAWLKDYWAMIMFAGGAMAWFGETRFRVSSLGKRLDRIEDLQREDIHRIEDKIDANHKEIIGYLQGMNK